MNYSTFKEIVEDAVSTTDDYFWEHKSSKEKKKNDRVIYISTMTGGTAGGNCWSDGGHYGIDGEQEDWTSFDNLLTKFCPNISFLLYRKIVSLFNSVDYTEREYYGNYTNYNVKYLKIKALWDILLEHKLIGSEDES